MDYFDWAIKLSRKRLRPSSMDVYRSMWNGYVSRLTSGCATEDAARPGDESASQMLAAIISAGEYSVQKRVFTLVRWTYDTLQKEGMELSNPSRHICRLFIPEVRLQHAMLDSSWQSQMIEAAANQATGWKKERLMAVVAVLCDTALKNQELIGLRMDSLQGSPPVRLIAGKGVKEREIPLSPRTSVTLQSWLMVRPTNPGDYLFVADTSGRPLDPTTLWRQLKKVTSTLPGNETLKHFGTGVIRATKAKELENRGESTSSIAGFLGHRQEASTGELLDRVSNRNRAASRSLFCETD